LGRAEILLLSPSESGAACVAIPYASLIRYDHDALVSDCRRAVDLHGSGGVHVEAPAAKHGHVVLVRWRLLGTDRRWTNPPTKEVYKKKKTSKKNRITKTIKRLKRELERKNNISKIPKK
jgi:hypothetical protein